MAAVKRAFAKALFFHFLPVSGFQGFLILFGLLVVKAFHVVEPFLDRFQSLVLLKLLFTFL